MEMDYATLLQTASELHGGACFGIQIGTRMAMSGLSRIGISDPKGADKKKLIVFVEIDRCATDSIMAITGCRPGKRTMKVLDHGKMAATFLNLETGKAFRVAASLKRKMGPPGSGAEDIDLGAIPEEELFSITEVAVELRPEDLPGKPLRTCNCEVCGERVMDGREVLRGDEALCRTCFEQKAYYRILEPSR